MANLTLRCHDNLYYEIINCNIYMYTAKHVFDRCEISGRLQIHMYTHCLIVSNKSPLSMKLFTLNRHQLINEQRIKEVTYNCADHRGSKRV